jgi:hypothetical protein
MATEEFKAGAVALTPAEIREAQARANDQAAQERAEVRIKLGMVAPGTVHAPAGMHPDHDEPIVFVRGEMLPEWAVRALLDQQPKLDQGVYKLAPVGRRKQPREVT